MSIGNGSMQDAKTEINLHLNDTTKHHTQSEIVALITWDNVANKPNFADPSWKATVATPANLPLSNNTIGDMRIVLNDGDTRGALYECIATTGTLVQQWKKIADVDWGVPDWSAIVNKPTTLSGFGITDVFTKSEDIRSICFIMTEPGNNEVSPKYVVPFSCSAVSIVVTCNTAPSSAITLKLYKNDTTELASFSVSTVSTTNDMVDASLTQNDTLHIAISGNSNSIANMNLEVRLVRS